MADRKERPILVLVGWWITLGWSQVDPRAWMEKRPESAFVKDSRTGQSMEFCSDWNPDFGFVGGVCCGKPARAMKRRGVRCDPARSKESFCDEMTLDQVDWFQKNTTGIRPASMALCGDNDGFLAWGKPLLSGAGTGIRLRNPQRCVHFGTDLMVQFLGWLGQRAFSEWKTELLVGDISAPRGGCLAGHGGRRGHFSHTSGRDVDLGFLVPQFPKGPESFSRNFEIASNYWMIKSIFANPSACVRAVFLDHRLIAKLSSYAHKIGDPEWLSLAPHVRHVRGHRNHFHVRIGDRAGPAGCDLPSETDEPEVALNDISLAND